MKAAASACAAAPGAAGGRVARARGGENAEIQMYLSKLQDLVPFMPKNRKISKLEVIQHVIDYICDLQSALETHPAGAGGFDAAEALGAEPASPQPALSAPPRQPLGVRSAPNTILPAHHHHHHEARHHHTTPEKSSQPDRPLSC